MKHLMLDLETFGIKPGSVLRSIGAVVFSLDGQMGKEFYLNIDEASSLAAGLIKDPGTVKWWSQQSAEAQAALLVNPWPLGNVVMDFHDFYRHSGVRTVWAQGANFDPALWEAAALAVNSPVPWKFYDVRDTRTAYELGKLGKADEPKRQGTYHNALDDAKHQVRCVAKAVAMGRGIAT